MCDITVASAPSHSKFQDGRKECTARPFVWGGEAVDNTLKTKCRVGQRLSRAASIQE